MEKIKPSIAIKERCKDCCQNKKDKTNLCKDCKLKNEITNLKKIKLYCKEFCMNMNNVNLCNSPKCDLYIFRFGKNPNKKGNPNGFKLRL
jgi:hypothetical protein